MLGSFLAVRRRVPLTLMLVPSIPSVVAFSPFQLFFSLFRFGGGTAVHRFLVTSMLLLSLVDFVDFTTVWWYELQHFRLSDARSMGVFPMAYE